MELVAFRAMLSYTIMSFFALLCCNKSWLNNLFVPIKKCFFCIFGVLLHQLFLFYRIIYNLSYIHLNFFLKFPLVFLHIHTSITLKLDAFGFEKLALFEPSRSWSSLSIHHTMTWQVEMTGAMKYVPYLSGVVGITCQQGYLTVCHHAT